MRIIALWNEDSVLDPVRSAIQEGDVLAGKYRVERVLGSGGMGVVVAARHVDLDGLRAIKILRPEMLEHASFVKRFLQEAQALTRLESDHVVRVYDVGKLDDGAPYMVMEHLVGADLRSVLDWHGPLPITEAVLCVLQACDAIIEAHAQGIIHRDLKPANLFLTRRPNGFPCLKVLDFGIAKVTEHRGFSPKVSATLVRLGSPAYMSPEQVRSVGVADTRTDVWGLGLILYELLTGQKAFWGKTPSEVLVKIMEAAPVPPSTYRADIPPGLEAVILWCLEKDIERRMQSAADLRRTLLPFGPREADVSRGQPNDPEEVTKLYTPRYDIQEVTPLATKIRPPPKVSASLEVAPTQAPSTMVGAEHGRVGLRGVVATLLMATILAGAALVIWRRYVAPSPNAVSMVSAMPAPPEASAPMTSAEPSPSGSQAEEAPPTRAAADTDAGTDGIHRRHGASANNAASADPTTIPAPRNKTSSSRGPSGVAAPSPYQPALPAPSGGASSSPGQRTVPDIF